MEVEKSSRLSRIILAVKVRLTLLYMRFAVRAMFRHNYFDGHFPSVEERLGPGGKVTLSSAIACYLRHKEQGNLDLAAVHLHESVFFDPMVMADEVVRFAALLNRQNHHLRKVWMDLSLRIYRCLSHHPLTNQAQIDLINKTLADLEGMGKGAGPMSRNHPAR